jgi:hypothetical protein
MFTGLGAAHKILEHFLRILDRNVHMHARTATVMASI